MISECVSIEKFHRCIKEKMKPFRGIQDMELVQNLHKVAVKNCSKYTEEPEMQILESGMDIIP